MRTAENRVVWSEGMFLRTQHFQQQDRYVERLVRDACRPLIGHGFGVSKLEIDESLLAHGKIAIRRCEGIMEDGTPFVIPEQADPPPPLTVTEVMGPGVIYLCLPIEQEGALAFEPEGETLSGTRYGRVEINAPDIATGADNRTEPIEIGRLRVSLRHEREDLGASAELSVCRVDAVQQDQLSLDREFIPPCFSFAVSDQLIAFLNELMAKLDAIAESRVAYVTGRRLHGQGDISDFLALQLANRSAAEARHLATDKKAHPEALFRFLLALAGEASTFVGPDHRPIDLPGYRHKHLKESFSPLINEIDRLLRELARPDPRSVQVPLQRHREHRGIFTADVQDKGLFTDAVFVLAVNAALAPEKIRDNFPRQIKLAPAETLADLVQTGRPGIQLRHLPAVPRQIPLHRGMTYFELDRQDENWRKLTASAGLALHVVDEFPELELECWAIRD